MTRLTVPSIRFQERLWPAAEVAARAAAWRAAAIERLSERPGLVATVPVNRPDAIALFLGLTALPVPVVVLPADPRGWRSQPAPPTCTPLVLHPELRGLASHAEASGYQAVVLDEPRRGGAPGEIDVFATPGFVLFTSGSTGLPRPIFRPTTASALAISSTVIRCLDLAPGTGIIGALPVASSFGVGSVLTTALLLGAEIALVERFDHRAVLALFATERYGYFPCIPMMVDLLARCPLTGPPPSAPRTIVVSGGRLGDDAFLAFTRRFGVPPRPSYGSTESGIIALDAGPAGSVQPGAVGPPLPGVEVAIGDDPRFPEPRGRPGRIWFRSPMYMAGYGFPPDLEPRPEQHGWWPTGDLGAFDESGRLRLTGRLDDCFKTATGHLVNPAEIVAALGRHPAVIESVVVPVNGRDGQAIGVVIEASAALDVASLRQHAAELLPAWAQPGPLLVVPRLPRLPGGKPDREACRDLLGAPAPPITIHPSERRP
jgi:acyl-coenzyme A synthetase/AMP-(fatty) acid ligase